MTGLISDLTAADRLRSASLFELQDQTIVGSPQMDAITLGAGIPFDTTTQLLGFTAANTMEVEATTLAARLTLRPDEINYPPAGWSIGRYSWSTSQFGYVSIGAGAIAPNHIIMEFGWLNVAGIAIIKKVKASFAVGASTNTAAGVAGFQMMRTYGLGVGLDTSSVISPGSQGGRGIGGRSPANTSTGMKTNQGPTQARINAGINRTSTDRGGGNAGQNAFVDPNPIGAVATGMIAGAGKSVFRDASLFDWMIAEQPLILVPGTGFEVQWTMPSTSAGSSSTVMVFCNMQWDEWTLSAPGGTNG